ncbi:MAG: DUF4402 domain-containing protein [Bacteroidota bacterium]
MKKSKLILSAMLLMVGFATYTKAQNTKTANAGVKILKPLTLTKTANLHFGTMTIPTGNVVITLSTYNNRTANNPSRVTLLPQSPVATDAAYNVNGSPYATYAITLPVNDVITNGPGGASALVTNFVARPNSAEENGLIGTLNGAGFDSFVVGARLNLVTLQAFGVYTGSFIVTVNYN